jgi:heterodisulfide reductase subunit A
MAGHSCEKPFGAVMVVGGGISGMQAALDAAESGYLVYLVEKNPSIGGRMAQLDKTFPTNDCATCMIAPRLVEVGRHPNIKTLTLTTVEEVMGEPGRFNVKVLQRPRFIDVDKCIACGTCASKCPKKVDDEHNQRLSKRKAAFLTFPQAVPLKYSIDPAHCIFLNKGRCKACEKHCPAGAIDFSQEAKVRYLNVGAIILAPGFDTFDARLRGEYGYGRYPNVLTSLDFERVLSASGPYQGHVQRPFDGQEPRKVAWIQCVGSRDASIGRDYCSSVCCMYATKQAIIAKEHVHEIEPTIFYMDLRAQGKGFDRYAEQAKDKYGVRYIRAMISQVAEVPATKNLLMTYLEEGSGEKREEEFDLVILSVGLRPGEATQRLAKVAGIELNRFGFAAHPPFDIVATSRPGIFVSGVFEGPKDIPETVMQSSAAAAEAGRLIASSRGTMTQEKVYPPERGVSGEEPRIGVFVCHCGNNIAGVVDVVGLTEYAKGLPFVRHAEHNLFTCSTDTQEKITEVIKEQRLNRVIVASCSPRTHEGLFQNSLMEAGLNKYLFEMTNIRDQCSWVHQNEPEKATAKAKELVAMSVARASLLEPLHEIPFRITQAALVVGGGVAGMTAALQLAEQGFKTHLVERSGELGGGARRLHFTLESDDVQIYVDQLVGQVEAHPLISVHKKAELVDHGGFVGKFTTVISVDGREKTLEHGVTIVATGAQEYKPTEYLYGDNPSVMTQLEFHEKLAGKDWSVAKAGSVVMIQCVGSRDGDHPYCSRVCCSAAVMNALKLKRLNPKASVVVLYRDMRTFGFRELFYKQAREAGVAFIRYDPGAKPVVTQDEGRLTVRVLDQNLGSEVELRPDFLVLSAAIRPHEASERAARAMRLPQDADGFFMEAHVKLRPLDFAISGVFLCGLAHGPKFLEESIAQAKGAVGRAVTVLAKPVAMVGGAVATVDGSRCVACLTCVRTCPFHVPTMDWEEGVIKIDPAACQGCGNCASACPRKAIEVKHYTDSQMIAKVSAIGRVAVAAGG